MDIPRKSAARNRMIRLVLAGVAFLAAIPLITWGLSRLKPAAPPVEFSTLWPDTVKRGEMVRQVRGLGTLVPEEALLIPATTAGRVERIRVRPGTPVKPDTVVMELSSPEMQTALMTAQFQLKQAEANYIDTKVQLERQQLDQKAAAATVQADYHQARLQADRDQKLAKEGLIPDLTQKLSTVKAEELSTRLELERKRLEIIPEQVQAQLAAKQVAVEQLRAEYSLKLKQVEALKVRAGAAGILQQIGSGSVAGQGLVEEGQSVTSGTVLAKVVQPWKLKAELKVPETQAKDIVIGQAAEIDTRNGVIPGKVSRIDPAAVNGTVTVDVRLEGALPQGARPDLSVDGIVELERLRDVLNVGRPVFGQANSTVMMFKIVPDGNFATRIPVKFGRSSVNSIEILEGLREGDKVILSDMSAWDQYDRIRLK